MAIQSLNCKNNTVHVENNAMVAISDEIFLCADDLRLPPHGQYLNPDRDACVEYRLRLGLEKAQWLMEGGFFF